MFVEGLPLFLGARAESENVSGYPCPASSSRRLRRCQESSDWGLLYPAEVAEIEGEKKRRERRRTEEREEMGDIVGCSFDCDAMKTV